MSKKYLYYFSEGNDAFGGDKVTMKNTLGGKGAGLAEMTAAGMPVPQGFTITTDAPKIMTVPKPMPTADNTPKIRHFDFYTDEFHHYPNTTSFITYPPTFI